MNPAATPVAAPPAGRWPPHSRVKNLEVAQPAPGGIPIRGDAAGRLDPRYFAGWLKAVGRISSSGKPVNFTVFATTRVQRDRRAGEPRGTRPENPSVFTQHHLLPVEFVSARGTSGRRHRIGHQRSAVEASLREPWP